jgi:hypothetical protein
MSDLENDLKRALRRQSPPAGFTGRVLAKLPRAEAKQPWWRRLVQSMQPSPMRWATATLALAVLLGVGTWQVWRSVAPPDQPRTQQEAARLEGERAKEQLMLALRITSAELREVQRSLADAGGASDSGPGR